MKVSCLLALLFILSLHYEGHSQECVNGLMSAERVRQLGRVAGGLVKDGKQQQRIIPDITFTCSGTVSKWIVAGELRTSEKNLPELQIWRKTNDAGVYTKIHCTTLTITAASSTEIYEYNTTDLVDVQSGDVLGMFEPNHSRLRFYYTDTYGPENHYERTDSDEVTPPNGTFNIRNDTDGSLIVYDMPLVRVEFTPTDGSPASDCISSFATIEAIEIGLQQDGGDRPIKEEDSEQRLIPGINFTCHGFITKWILAAEWQTEEDRINFPELQTWNSTDGTTYTKQGATTFSVSGGSEEMSYYEYSPDPPHEFNDGDVLGMFIPDKTRLRLFFVRVDSGPVNYFTGTGARTSAPGDYTTAGQGTVNTVPLVAVIMSVSIPSPISTKTSVASASSTLSNYSTTSQQVSTTYVSTGTASDATATSRYQKSMPQPLGGTELNPMRNSMNPMYASANQHVYEDIEPLHYEEFVACTMKDQRKVYEDSEAVYAVLESTVGSRDEAEVYFQESEIYWAPASSKSDLYAQLSENLFREIPRPHIIVTDLLGAGQFGQVSRGIWQTPSGSTDVAVKMLRPSASEEEKVKFLQEAAIMGQFHHPNVVTLHGVVTVVEPAMIILELMKFGDLRSYLQSMQPTPGKLVPSNTPRTCLDFCCQIASGMDYLSKKAFVHRDLAARNILVSEQKKCKIADFGMSRDLGDGDYYVSQGGKFPVKWTAPEAINYKRYSTASDVWSYGAVMYEIWSLGHKPFEGYSNMQVILLVNKGTRLPPPPGCPKAVYQLMIDCWHPGAGSRPSFPDLLQSLSRPETELLSWTGEDTKIHPQAAVLGGPLDAGKTLYLDLQSLYTSD